MFDLEILRNKLGPSIKVNTLCLSYVTRILPEFKDKPYIVLYKEESEKFFHESVNSLSDDEASHFDITGSPLKCSFTGEDDFEDTVILVKQNWCKVEEKYLPLSRTEACNALNACIDLISNPFHLLIALCDGKDSKKSRLLGAISVDECFTTIEVCCAGTETLEVIENSSFKFLEKHVEFMHAEEHDVDISVFTTFDLFGTQAEMINWDNNKKSLFEGSLSLEVDSCSLSLYPTIRASKNNLVAQIVTNSSDSPLKELWTQLLVINQYLNIIESYKNNMKTCYTSAPLEFPHDFISPYKEEHDVILKNISSLLNGDYSFRNSQYNKNNKTNCINKENIDDVKVEEYVQNLPFRCDLDFTDFLWELLIMNSNYFEMAKCIYTVFEETVTNGCLPQVNFTNTTRFAKVITKSHHEGIISHFLSGSLPLEYAIDMGFEKLYKDYTYILVNARFAELHDIKQTLNDISNNEFSVESYRNGLLYLAQIHVCLEFMLLLQNNLECPSDDLRFLFRSAFEKYVGKSSPIKNCHLYENKIYTLITALPPTAINNLSRHVPSTRRVSLSSQSKLSKLTSIRYYTQQPIFPTNIYSPENSNAMDAMYYVTSATCSSRKFK